MFEAAGIVIAGIVIAMVVYIIGFKQGRDAALDDAEAKLQPLSPNRCWLCRQDKVKP
jgi:hypothetical protein